MRPVSDIATARGWQGEVLVSGIMAGPRQALAVDSVCHGKEKFLQTENTIDRLATRRGWMCWL